MRLALSALVVLSGACVAEEDHGPVRNPGGGGGGGGSGQGGDARMVDAGGSDGGDGAINGLVCVVSDLRSPDACPAVAARIGVSVKAGAATAVSGDDGRFTIAASGAVAVLDLADGSATLERSVVPVAVGPSLVHTPVILEADFADVLTSLDQAVPDGGGTVVVYVQDGTGPAAGVAFDAATGSSIAPYYDDGAALQWRQGGGTGLAGVALFVDVPAGSATLTGTAPDQRVARVSSVPVIAGAITFVRVGLANL
jgi:hypothetical protein